MQPILFVVCVYWAMFIFFNSMRLFKPYDNGMLFNPIVMVREFLNDMRTPKD